jgi:4-hydroxybenzoyl-CoA thioesterase
MSAVVESRMTKTTNIRTVRIEWGDCDPAGIIYYPRYFEIVDAATAALFENALGMTKYHFTRHYAFAGFPVVTTRARFIKPTRYGDDVRVESTISFGTSSFSVEHRLSLNGEPCCECSEKRVWVGRDPADPSRIKSMPIPAAVREKFGVS